MVGQCRKKVPVNNFEWIEDTPQSNEDFIKSCNDFSKLFFNILKTYMNFIMIYHFYLKESKVKKSKILLLIYIIKLNMLSLQFKAGIKKIAD